MAFIVLLLIFPAAYAVTHTVGGNNGWTTNVNYTDWASRRNFTTGDTLVFNYGLGHSVDVVLKDDYTNCTTLNTTSSYTTSPTNIILNDTGPWYFICPSLNHCNSGQKLAINVTAGSNPPSSSPPPASGSVPSTPVDTPPAAPGMPPLTTTPTLPSTAANLDNGNNLMVGLMSLVLAAIVGVMG